MAEFKRKAEGRKEKKKNFRQDNRIKRDNGFAGAIHELPLHSKIYLKGEKVMMRTKRYLESFLLGGLLLVWGCGFIGVPRESADQPTPRLHTADGNQIAASVKDADSPVVCYLKTRDKIITIRCGAHGPLYTVKGHNGEMLAENISASQIRARFPELRGIVEDGLAKGITWAGL